MSKLATPRLDKRTTSRTRISVSVHMGTRLGPPLSCTLKDVSELGARLAVNEPAVALQEFLILLGDKLARWYRSAGARTSVGIAFVGEPRSLKETK
jgi:hypothetical protein